MLAQLQCVLAAVLLHQGHCEAVSGVACAYGHWPCLPGPAVQPCCQHWPYQSLCLWVLLLLVLQPAQLCILAGQLSVSKLQGYIEQAPGLPPSAGAQQGSRNSSKQPNSHALTDGRGPIFAPLLAHKSAIFLEWTSPSPELQAEKRKQNRDCGRTIFLQSSYTATAQNTRLTSAGPCKTPNSYPFNRMTQPPCIPWKGTGRAGLLLRSLELS